MAAALAHGTPDVDALSAARTALLRARRLVDEHGMQELSARIGFSDVVLTALEGDPVSALGQAHERLDDWRAFGRGNRLILALVATARIALLADRPRDARRLVGEAMRLIAECAWPGPLRGAAEVLAQVSAATDPEAAATLLGAADARPPTHRWRMFTDLTATRAMLEDALGQERFTARQAEGAQLNLDDVAALAGRVLTADLDAPLKPG